MIERTTTFTLLSACIFVATFAQRQYFHVRPANATVAQGDSAVIHCTVGNQIAQGSTHWTKDGAVMGFDYLLPGFPRYQIIGNHALGEYHLEISRAELEDDAAFECQVTPTAGETDELRATAYVTVTVPPDNVTLDGYRNDNTIDARNGVALEVSCRANGAKPAADIRWFRNGHLISERFFTNQEVAQDEKRYTTISKLRWTPTPDDNQAVFTCDVLHPALSASKILKAQFTLSVIYPPGVPTISNYNAGRTLIANDYLQLRCLAENGNPPPEVIWYRESVSCSRNYTSFQGYTRNDYGFYVTAADNDVEYRCEASNVAAITPLSASVRLKVFFPPETVTVTGPLEAKIGDLIHFQCKTSASHPQAKIEWLIDGEQATNSTQRSWDASTGTGRESSSSVTVKVTKRHSEMTVVCTAVNEQLPRTSNRDTSETKIVRINYPPDSVKLTLSEEKTLTAGQTVTLACVATGGSPMATIEWFKNERRVTSGTSAKSGTENTTVSELSFTVAAENNLEDIECRAYNLASGSERLKAKTTLHVQFPPTEVRITPKPTIFRAKVPGELNCESGSANPSPTVEWYRNGELQTSVVAHNKTGNNGGWVVKKKLFLEPTLEDNEVKYECRASSAISARPIVEPVTIIVHYKPIFLVSVKQTLEVLEGEEVVLNATADANPQVQKYSWFKDAFTVVPIDSEPPRVLINGPILEIKKVLRADAGSYICRAKNSIGLSNMSASIVVKYPAEIDYISPDTYVESGDNVTLHCDVGGFPISAEFVRWENLDKTSDQFVKRRTFTSFEKFRSSLTIPNATRADTGQYACIANNGIAPAASRKVSLYVKHVPIFDEQEFFDRAAAPQGKDGILRCVAIGIPDAEIIWQSWNISNLNEHMKSDSYIGQYSIASRGSGPHRVESHLIIRNVRHSHYGVYRCIAKNELGVQTTAITFEPPGMPEQPKDIRITNVTHDTVTLSWKPGFDGGLSQKYYIRYFPTVPGRQPGTPTVVTSSEPSLTIHNLQMKTKYMFFVKSSNDKGSPEYPKFGITAETWGASNIVQEDSPEENFVLIIILVGLVVIVFLVVNTFLVVCFIRRHRRRQLRALEKTKIISGKETSNGGDSIMVSQDEKATNARLGDASTRKIQMYSSDNTASTALVNTRPDSQYASDAEARPHSALSEDESLRTVIEVDNHGDSSPHFHNTYVAEPFGDYGETPSNAIYAETLRSNSLQRQMANGVYSVAGASFRDQNKNTYTCGQLVDDGVPPALGPLRSLSQELDNYAPYSHYHPMAPVSRHGLSRRYSPQSSQSGSVATIVQSNGRTPYAEVRPILTGQNVGSPTPSAQSNVSGTANGGGNNGSPILSTFAAPRSTKPDYVDLDGLAGDLV